MSREYTTDEVQSQFIEQIRTYAHYWEHVTLEPEQRPELRHRLEGFAHSILAVLDGTSDLPLFMVIACPHPDDKAFCIAEGENYYAEPSLDNDISGNLHELFYKR